MVDPLAASAFSSSEHLAFAILGSEDADRTDAGEFWESAIDGEPPADDDFAKGFAEGAL